MNQQLDDSKESVQSQSVERYLQVESTKNSLSPIRIVQTSRPIDQHNTSSILKLQNGKYSCSQTVFQEALNKKKQELIKKPSKQIIEISKRETINKTKIPKKLDKVQQNIKLTQQQSNDLKKKKEEEKIKEQQQRLKTEPQVKETSEEVFLETVNRLYDFEKRRIKQLEKMVVEEKQKNEQKLSQRPIINQKSCILLDKKLKQLVEQDENYKTILQYREQSIQVDLLPHLPKLKDFVQLNAKQSTLNFGQLEIVIDVQPNEEQIELSEEIQYNENQSHKLIQTNEIKYKLSDTIKKQPSQSQIQQTVQDKETPKKKKQVENTRQKRQEIMEIQSQRVKTDCQYYVPLHLRQQQVIQKKQEWIQQQKELKKQIEEKQEQSQREEWEKEKEKWSKKKNDIVNKSTIDLNVNEFVNQQLSWLEKRNENILNGQIKKDKELVQSLTFRPQIQKRNTEKQLGNEKVEDRLLDYQTKKQENLQKLENKYLPTFQPNTSSKSLLNMDWASKSFSNASFNKLWE